MSKKQKRPGKVVPDNKVITIWRCDTCGTEVQLPPKFYAEAGIPICLGHDPDADESLCEGNDMSYVETRIL